MGLWRGAPLSEVCVTASIDAVRITRLYQCGISVAASTPLTEFMLGSAAGHSLQQSVGLVSGSLA